MKTSRQLLGAFACVVAAASTACTLEEPPVPALSGPSGIANAIALSASPHELPRDGSSSATVTVTATDVSGGPLAGQRIALSVNPADAPVSATEVTTDASGRAAFTVTSPPAGSSASAIAIAATPLGGFSDLSSRSLSIALLGGPTETAPPPTVTAITASPASPVVDASASFSVTAAAATGRQITQYTWTFGDGTPTVVTTLPTTTHAFVDPGSHVITVTATDDLGQTTSLSSSVTVITGVTASFTMSPTNPEVGDLVRFDPLSSTIPAHISVKEYRWDFGNGSTETTTPQSPVGFTTFTAARTYTIRLTVIDTKGRTTTTTQTVSVSEP